MLYIFLYTIQYTKKKDNQCILQILTCGDNSVSRSTIISGLVVLDLIGNRAHIIQQRYHKQGFQNEVISSYRRRMPRDNQVCSTTFPSSKNGNVVQLLVTLHTIARLPTEIQAASYVANSSFGERAVLSVLRRRSALSLLHTSLNVISSLT
ncbi:Hypothetical_protein [Hexamita inflata]|nr:Hypothetical protein HINF_LOCUS16277 [Hexamita inflata]CAI9928637.1 Hypothetical protein HINF_LOCUS16282 [Hexamita inflata]